MTFLFFAFFCMSIAPRNHHNNPRDYCPPTLGITPKPWRSVTLPTLWRWDWDIIPSQGWGQSISHVPGGTQVATSTLFLRVVAISPFPASEHLFYSIPPFFNHSILVVDFLTLNMWIFIDKYKTDTVKESWLKCIIAQI